MACVTNITLQLLISLPKHIRSDFEAPSIQAIGQSAETFEQQCATQLTGCALQARFLKSVIQKYESLTSQPFMDNNQLQGSTTHNHPSILSTNVPDTLNIHRSSDSRDDSENSGHYPQTQDVLGTNLFADKDLWNDLFADVESWMPGGVSLSDNSSFI